MPNTGPKLPRWTIKRGITDERNKNWTSSFCDSPFILTSFLVISMANPKIIVRFAMLEPRTFPTESPPSPAREATVETDSSGSDVVMERSIKPAAISESPSLLDKISTYRIILSLINMIISKDIASRRMLYTIINSPAYSNIILC